MWQSFHTLSEEKLKKGPKIKVVSCKKGLLARLKINQVNHDVYQFRKYIQNSSLYFAVKDTSLFVPFAHLGM